MKNRTFGYARISTTKQNIERQIKNIKQQNPDAIIITEEYTGTTTDRPAWNKLQKQLRAGDVVIFDEVSRMSRNADEGVALYEELFDKGVNLVFIKEPHINTSVYRDKLQKQMDKVTGTGNAATDKLLNTIIEALHEYTIDLAKEQIALAFQTAEAEVEYLHQRTSEGVKAARERYEKAVALGETPEKQKPGRAEGSTIETRKAKEQKQVILKHSKDFNGTLSDAEVMKLTGLARNTFYKYKKQLKQGA